ncbi:DUF6925 family protein [Paenirhodobacter sp.]|uniref:DUF6925 family protein n=1 Tax=Paenirhodobacter sp. TaxID=1965326 RepID=UPI003B3F7ABB
MAGAIDPLLRRMFGAEGHLWSVGTLAAFMALPCGVPVAEGADLVLRAEGCTARLRPGGRLLAFETLSSDPRGWNHGIAICLPATAPPPPADAPDLGLGQGPVRAMFRPDVGRGEGLTREDAARMPGTWIIDTPVLRAERREGLHQVAQAQATGRTHAETTPVPPGLIPVAHVFPPHPARGVAAFDPARHRAFQAILSRHGRADLWALKSAVLAQLADGRFDPPVVDRHGAAVIRVALRQHLHLSGDVPRDWLAHFDRPLLRGLEAGR